MSQHPDALILYDETNAISVSTQYQTDNPDRKGRVKSHTEGGGMMFMNSNIRLRNDQHDNITSMKVIFCLKSRVTRICNLIKGEQEGQGDDRMR